MKVTHELEIDLTRDAGAAALAVMEGDAYSRVVRVSLTQGRRAWAVPEDVSVVVHYQKPDGTSGVYDTMPDGSEAWSIEGGRLLLCLAPQMLTAAGTVQVRVRLLRGDAVLSVFPFRLNVGKGLAEGAESEDYVNWRGTFLPQTAGAQVGQWLRITEVDDAGRVLAVEPVNEPGVDEETLARAVSAYLEANPPQESDPTVPAWAKAAEKPSYTAEEVGALSASELQPAINTALAQAKASGEFDGADGKDGADGQPGTDYTLTDADKAEIAEQAAQLVEIPETTVTNQPLTFTGAVNATYDGSEAVEVEIPSGGGGDGGGTALLLDETLTEAVVSLEYAFDKAYRYLDIYVYTPIAESNTTNNNDIWLHPNGIQSFRFRAGQISIYGQVTFRNTVRCYAYSLTVEGICGASFKGDTKNIDKFAEGLQTITLIPNTSGETDMIPVGTHIIIRGREEL